VGASPRVEIYRVKPPSKGIDPRQTFDFNGIIKFAYGELGGTIEDQAAKG
jgi:hypothetical protein